MRTISDFQMTSDTAVLTTRYVIEDGLPTLEVSHDIDEEDGSHLWQFHCGNGDYDMSKIMVVGLSTMLRIDPTLYDVARLPVGFTATRTSNTEEWVFRPSQAEPQNESRAVLKIPNYGLAGRI